MAEFQVTVATLQAKKGELENLNKQLKTKIDDLAAKEQELGTMWEGDAKNAFHAAFTSDKGQMDNFVTAINQYIAAIETAISQYNAAEAKNVGTATTRTYK